MNPQTPKADPAAKKTAAPRKAPAKKASAATAAKAKTPVKAAAVAKLVKATKPPKAEKRPAKPPRVKLVRDGFTLPETDYALFAALKGRALKAQRETKKSELLRAGLQALAAMSDEQLLAALQALAPVKIGRPKKGH